MTSQQEAESGIVASPPLPNPIICSHEHRYLSNGAKKDMAKGGGLHIEADCGSVGVCWRV